MANLDTPTGVDIVTYELRVIRAQEGIDAAMDAARDMATAASIIFATARGYAAAVDLLRQIEQLLPNKRGGRAVH
jgi:hypothetical protein